MLPSPTWPKGNGRAPGIIAVTAAPARRMNSGTAATGTAMSCLIEPPSSFCTSDSAWRMRQKALDWSSERAWTPSSTTSRATPSPKIASTVCSASASEREDDTSNSTYQSWRPGDRVAGPGHMAEHDVDRDPRDQFERREPGGGLGAGNVEKRQCGLRILDPDEGDAHSRAASETAAAPPR